MEAREILFGNAYNRKEIFAEIWGPYLRGEGRLIFGFYIIDSEKEISYRQYYSCFLREKT